MAEDDTDKSTAEERPVIPLMTWEDYENGKEGPLNLPGFTEMPALAERVFFILAREWRASVKSGKPRSKERVLHEATIVLSCLLLTVRWGGTFTRLVMLEISTNRNVYRVDDGGRWLDDLAWDLCRYLLADLTSRKSMTDVIETLVANLDHHRSAIRIWIMDLTWLFRAHIPVVYIKATVDALLKNLADTLIGPFQSAALASRFFITSEAFFTHAQQFRPPATFKDQYEACLSDLKSTLPTAIAPFLETENQCWQLITETIFGKLFVPFALPPAFVGKDLFPHLACPEPSSLPALTPAQAGLLSRLGHIWHTRYTRRELDMLVSLPWNQLPPRLKDKTIRYHDDPSSLKRPEDWPTLGTPEDKD